MLRKMWLAPSQMAQAEMPLLQNTSSLGMPSRFAKAPVATITLFVRTCRCSLISGGMLNRHELAADVFCLITRQKLLARTSHLLCQLAGRQVAAAKIFLLFR